VLPSGIVVQPLLLFWHLTCSTLLPVDPDWLNDSRASVALKRRNAGYCLRLSSTRGKTRPDVVFLTLTMATKSNRTKWKSNHSKKDVFDRSIAYSTVLFLNKILLYSRHVHRDPGLTSNKNEQSWREKERKRDISKQKASCYTSEDGRYINNMKWVS